MKYMCNRLLKMMGFQKEAIGAGCGGGGGGGNGGGGGD